MTNPQAVLDSIHRAIAPVEEAIREHPIVKAVEDGRVSLKRLRPFVGEQWWIIQSDLRSVGLLVARSETPAARDFFVTTLQGEAAALEALRPLASALGMDEGALNAYEPTPGGQAYPAYMAWLALHGTASEVAAAFVVNFPAWGANCGRLSRALTTRYGLTSAQVAFLDLFANPSPEFTRAALGVVREGLEQGVPEWRLHRAARLLQAYEQQYWDTIWTLARG